MSTVFPPAPSDYDTKDEGAFRTLVKRALDACFQRGETVEIGHGRLVLKDTVTGTRYAVTVASGAVVLTATTQ